ncbi:hypothetical protein XNC1_0860 [Xenorhabdus nematophila ATCC 19061]|uniref:Uncharacterized protein n=1 Tax=Xenorhabdus nematophila (strain ATCC 19061 / DSM 3370 / CCUG 14189 / LMG 1036 / NCIMB 9965 / AN6) TaxID=406817 RepID=D3VKH9_XENNA|nr:hypothetical protein XNC1_0860 [Xenorhabdus nematophila ATCC 19061]CEE92311.1 hypothetical protein XNA1_2750012 [Xenorhabdus nematophila str. Anatoliense]CEE93048.1 hypothetical protein XNA1_330011 [Xenorhabdus nematophila str. Anatoliense]CEK21841.1 hypothetical protein XNC2_0845 [Xenorhabdus nematophila AN6/1]
MTMGLSRKHFSLAGYNSLNNKELKILLLRFGISGIMWGLIS